MSNGNMGCNMQKEDDRGKEFELRMKSRREEEKDETEGKKHASKRNN